MDENGIIKLPGNLDPRAEEFRPRNNENPYLQNRQITLLQPQIYYPSYPSPSVHPHQLIPFYGGLGYQHIPSSSSPAYFRPSGDGAPPLPLPPPPPASATRSLLISSVPTDTTEEIVRKELEVFGEIRGIEMRRLLQDGIVTVHFYDLRHAQTAMIEIQEQHMHQQSRLRHQYYHNSSFYMPWGGGLETESFLIPPPPPPPLGRGLIAGRVVWAQYTLPAVMAGSDGHNQGTLIVFNLDPAVSASQIKEIFETFGPVKELRETPSKRNQRFIEFYDIRDADKALKEMNGKEINGQSVLIEFSRPGGNRRKLSSSNSTTPQYPLPFNSLSKNMNSSSSFYSRITTYPPSYPNNLNQEFQQNQKKPMLIRGSNTWNNNQRQNYGEDSLVLDDQMASLSMKNGCESEGSSGSSSRRSMKIKNHFQTGIKHQQVGKQQKTKSWKGKQKNLDSHFLINEDSMIDPSCIRDTRTTVMIKNIPNKYSQKLLLNMLDNHCIHYNEKIRDDEEDDQPLSAYDFVYLPIDFNNKCNVGYGFVNLTSPQAALRLYKAFHLQSWEVFNSRKICQVTYARLQGLEALKEHFKNSKFACETDEYLPVVFSPPRDGKQVTDPIAIVGRGASSSVTGSKKLEQQRTVLVHGDSGESTEKSELVMEEEDFSEMDGQDDKLEGGHDDEDDGGESRSWENDCGGIDDEVVIVKKNTSTTTSSTTTTGNCLSSSSVVAGTANGCLSTSEPKQQPNLLSCAQVN